MDTSRVWVRVRVKIPMGYPCHTLFSSKLKILPAVPGSVANDSYHLVVHSFGPSVSAKTIYNINPSTFLLATPLSALNPDIESKFNNPLTWRRLTWLGGFVEYHQPWNQLFLLSLPPCSQSQTPKHIQVQRRAFSHGVMPRQAVIGHWKTEYVVILFYWKALPAGTGKTAYHLRSLANTGCVQVTTKKKKLRSYACRTFTCVLLDMSTCATCGHLPASALRESEQLFHINK